jgi:hypothetical protein
MKAFVWAAAAFAVALAAAPAQAQTVKHYQQTVTVEGGQCASDACTAAFAVVPAGNTLRVTSVSCIFTKDNSSFATGVLKVLNASDGLKFSYVLAPSFDSGGGRMWVSQPVDLLLVATQHPAVTISVNGGINGLSMTCTLTGTLTKT